MFFTWQCWCLQLQFRRFCHLGYFQSLCWALKKLFWLWGKHVADVFVQWHILVGAPFDSIVWRSGAQFQILHLRVLPGLSTKLNNTFFALELNGLSWLIWLDQGFDVVDFEKSGLIGLSQLELDYFVADVLVGSHLTTLSQFLIKET